MAIDERDAVLPGQIDGVLRLAAVLDPEPRHLGVDGFAHGLLRPFFGDGDDSALRRFVAQLRRSLRPVEVDHADLVAFGAQFGVDAASADGDQRGKPDESQVLVAQKLIDLRSGSHSITILSLGKLISPSRPRW
jgi:hypothetical protein